MHDIQYLEIDSPFKVVQTNFGVSALLGELCYLFLLRGTAKKTVSLTYCSRVCLLYRRDYCGLLGQTVFQPLTFVVRKSCILIIRSEIDMTAYKEKGIVSVDERRSRMRRRMPWL